MTFLLTTLREEKTRREIASTHRLVVVRGDSVLVPGWDDAFLDLEGVLPYYNMHARVEEEKNEIVIVFTSTKVLNK